MSLDKPGPDVAEAIRSAMAWLEASKLTGLRVAVRQDPMVPGQRDKIVVQDPAWEAKNGLP